MSSLVVTPAQFAFTGGDIPTFPIRFTAGNFAFTGGSIFYGAGATLVTEGVPTLDRYTIADKPPGMDAMTWQRQVAMRQTTCERIEAAFEAQLAFLIDLSATLELSQKANTTATSVNEAGALEKSYTDNPVNPLSATSSSISIAQHERVYVYANVEDAVTVNAGTITGLTPETKYWVYYQDSARAGGTVSYQATTNPVAQTGAVTVVGSITLPALGQPDTTGTSPSAPGAIDPADAAFYESLNPRGTYVP